MLDFTETTAPLSLAAQAPRLDLGAFLIAGQVITPTISPGPAPRSAAGR